MLARLSILFFVLALFACTQQQPAFKSTDVTGAAFGRDFQLTDHNGKPRSLSDFKGKVVVLFFGYTHCPDFCPTTLAQLAGVVKQLGADSDKVQVLFVTLDPERDTQALLAQYVPAFDSRFLGLYGDVAATAKVAQEFKIVYAKQPGKTADSYTLDHSAGTYIFDQQGKLRLFVSYGQPAEAISHDIKELLNHSS